MHELAFDDRLQLHDRPFDIQSTRTKPAAWWTLDGLADRLDDELDIAGCTFAAVDHHEHNAIHDRRYTSHPN